MYDSGLNAHTLTTAVFTAYTFTSQHCECLCAYAFVGDEGVIALAVYEISNMMMVSMGYRRKYFGKYIQYFVKCVK